MGFAEKKAELFKIVEDADEETTGKLIEFAKKINHPTQKFTDDELEKFHATRKRYLSDASNTIFLEDAHAYIRSLKQK